jgi:biotin synthase
VDTFNDALAGALAGQRLNRVQIIALLSADPAQMPALFAAADEVRRAGVGNQVHLRAIIEFSNHCRKNCLYCGLRRDNRNLPRYRMTKEEIVQTAGAAAALGYHTVVLQAGEDLFYTTADIAQIIAQIKDQYHLTITLSLGERSREDYKIWREAGARRYLLKQETAESRLFQYLKPDTNLAYRKQCLYWLKELGYQTGAGNMVGLPGQTMDTLAKDILLMDQLEVEMAGIGPFLPHHSTPLKDAPAGDLDLTLKTLAVTRLCLPRAHLPATTALCTLAPNGRKLALNCGANVIMPNLTPLSLRSKYQIYPHKAGIMENPRRARTRGELCKIGLREDYRDRYIKS